MRKTLFVLSLVLMLALPMTFAAERINAAPFADGKFRIAPEAKNVILLVPDGMGLSYVTATRILKNGPNGAPLAFETLDFIGYQRTHAANSTVTDSAAAGSAWAIGQKVNNGVVSCLTDEATGLCVETPITVLQAAEAMGMSSGLVASSQVTHATPAVFGAAVHSRSCGTEIFRQFVEVSDVDVILGGGVYRSGRGCEIYGDVHNWGMEEVLDLTSAHGYAYASDIDELEAAVASGSDKVLGLFRGWSQGKSVEAFRLNPYLEEPYDAYPEGEPTLAEMTSAALSVLERDPDGFFLMVEGSQIDWAGHGNNMHYLTAEMLAFDAMVEVVLEWVNADPIRRATTTVIVVGDHDTGGLQINGPYGRLSEQGEFIEDGWTSGGHTAVDTVIWSQGPQAWQLNRAVDNTDLYQVMLDAIGY